MTESDQGVFEKHRPMLEGLAYRMCGVLADTQDIIQETHIKWCNANRSEIEDARSPDSQAEIDDSVSVALMLAMERLTPAERAAFLLHDVFGYDFGEIASIIGKSEESCRKSGSRARKVVREDRPRFTTTPDSHRHLLDAFLEAVRGGDQENLKALLSESIELHSDGGGIVKTSPAVLYGPEAVSEFFLEVWRQNVSSIKGGRIVHQWFNGQPGVLLYQESQLRVAISLSVENRIISHLFALRNPESWPLLSDRPASDDDT